MRKWALLLGTAGVLSLEGLARRAGWGLPPPSPPDEVRGVVYPAAPGSPRLLVLGDSIPWGYGLADPADAWPVLVGKGLAARGEVWQVVDVSIPGETTLQGWARWRRDGRPWKARHVFIAFGLNDCHLHHTPWDAWRWAHVPQGWGRVFRLLHVLRTRRIPRPQDTLPRLRPRLTPEQTASVLASLIRDIRRAGSTAWVLTPTPVAPTFHPEWPAPVRAYQAEVCARTREAIVR
ncbi:MAG: hypothetical protein GXO55_08025, partial [Chloroflexi bacterium]|nr:hypothetical protein [Chloroflexota bacterium]